MAGFARRSHSAVIGLAPGQVRVFRLPPMSTGPVSIRIFGDPEFLKPRDDGGSDGDGSPGGHQSIPHGVELELRHGDHLSVKGDNLVGAESLWHDDLWRLRVKRQALGPIKTPLSYRIEAHYPSQLPILERRIPASFFHDGFEVNYNRQQYIGVRIVKSNIIVTLRPDFSALYGLKASYEFDVSPVVFTHEVDPTSIHLDVGAGPRPQIVDNQLFFSVRAEFPAVDLQVAIPGRNPGLHIPPFFITARFFLHRVGASLEYVAALESDLLDRLDTNIRATVTEKLEDGLNRLQVVGGLSRFGSFLRPWLVGGIRELTALSYSPGAGDRLRPDGIVEPATGELVVGYVGSRPKPSTPPVLEDPSHPTGPAPDDGAERLFDVPDEDPDPDPVPSPGGGVTPGPHHPPQIGALANIDHIVVLMQENRSFDQVLGYLSRNKLNPDVLGLFPPDDPRSAEQVNRFGNRNFFPKRASSTAWPKVVGPSVDLVNSPCHDHDCVVSQMNNHMGGFVANWAERAGATSPFLRVVMEFFDNDQLQVYARLAREFGVCNHWYTSHVGPTFPNRFVLLTGDLNRDPLGNVELDQPDVTDLVPVQTPTLFDHLDDLGVSWRVFEHGYSFIRLFEKHTFDTTNVVAFDDPVRGFEALARSGALPPVTLIEPDYIDLPPGNDDHPPADIADGQVLVRRIAQALVSSPAWERTLFVITYDEHGGFYDHVQPPTDAAPLGGSLTTLGPRVPAFVVSPLVARGAEHGTTFNDRFDHTSIGATILRRFAGLRPPPHVSPRLDAANDLRTTLTLADPRPRSEFVDLFKGLPPLPAPHAVRRSKLPSRGAPIGAPDGPREDFHWLLAGVRLTTGEPPHGALLH